MAHNQNTITWTLLSEEEEYIQSLEKRLQDLKGGKVRPRGLPSHDITFAGDVDSAVDITAQDYPVYGPRYTATDDLLADMRDDLEYDISPNTAAHTDPRCCSGCAVS